MSPVPARATRALSRTAGQRGPTPDKVRHRSAHRLVTGADVAGRAFSPAVLAHLGAFGGGR